MLELGCVGLAGGLAGCGDGGGSSDGGAGTAAVAAPTPTPTPTPLATPVASAAVQQLASFEGSWFPVTIGGTAAMLTIRGGDYLRFGLSGSDGVVLGCQGLGSGYPPVLDMFVGGARVGDPVVLTSATGVGYAEATIPVGAASGTRSVVELRVRGVHENDRKWVADIGLAITGLRPTAAGGVISPDPDGRPAILGLGDSTLETIVARATPSEPATSAGDASWLRVAGDALGLKPLHNGFGGTGLLTTGSGGVPALYDPGAADPFASSNARLLAAGVQRNFAAASPRAIVLCTGYNDNKAGVSAASWQAAAVAFLRQTLVDYPAVEAVALLPSFAGRYYATAMQSAVDALADARVGVMDTSALGIAFTDGIHPTLAAQSVIGAAVATWLQPQLGAG